ncbi:conserved hypothetical protein [Thiomonas arsenitoxydans]|uniref:Fungal lipase-type domain-containing protein n=2 Tax=Thiomonas TaxID=32012 RepID=A0A238D3P9_THIDL|nr:MULTISPECIES: hypothetical protein [Thiomonas]CAZ87330.1 hypothetical protein, putative lipase domain [Thiomonas arsenitoxydans]CAZ90246.1 hypothetical protein, putative lipase domain [Thiomonas arsenitoxydans]CQR28937.1 conserved hypothetical protein [Thiomonas arsenitoxydans]CQR28940.1 conserved hypothetical protein [Thiomonas arsenitoxydans]CQR30387.1 conserved hypothetical protein [Thiomonas arsenitoxydans]
MAFSSGYQFQEARDALNLCMQLNGNGLPAPAPLPPPPTSWTLDFASLTQNPASPEPSRFGGTQDGVGPFNNAWAGWRNSASTGASGSYAIVIRGTVGTVSSMLDDALATTVQCNASFPLTAAGPPLGNLSYATVKPSNSEKSGVHLGFLWSALVLLYHKDIGILKKLQQLPRGCNILICGHSQGAAIATLLHSLLLHSSGGTDALAHALETKEFNYKSYVFAQPKPGNWQYGHDFAQAAGNIGLAICVNNSRDWVPQTPLALDLPDEVINNPIDSWLARKNAILKTVAACVESSVATLRDGLADVVKHGAEAAAGYLGQNIDTSYLAQGPSVNNATPYLNYVQCGKLYSLEAVPAPDEENADSLWQHHLGNYSALLDAQGASFI